MNAGLIASLENWFWGYVDTFLSQPHLTTHPGLLLKQEHTRRVCAEIGELGVELDLPQHDLHLAHAIALFHDIGRFEQYTRHATYVDRGSVDHGELGVSILCENQVLRDLDELSRETICFAVRYHNKAVLPDPAPQHHLMHARLIRDADKLDIWNIVNGYYHRGACERNEAIEVSLPDTAGVSPGLCEAVANGRIGNIADIHNLNDFKILQLGWVYDLYYYPTFRKVEERGYLESIRDALPQLSEVTQCYQAARSFLERRLQRI